MRTAKTPHPDHLDSTTDPFNRLHCVEQDEFACVFDAHGTMLRVTAVREVAKTAYTVLGWRVDAIEALTAKGVAFARYDGMDQDINGVRTTPEGDKVAWFTDPDGNNLSVTQLVSQQVFSQQSFSSRE